MTIDKEFQEKVEKEMVLARKRAMEALRQIKKEGIVLLRLPKSGT